MESVNERILKIYNDKGFRKYSEFAEKTGLSHQTVSNYLKGKQKPDVEKLSIIQQSFDDVNAEWLLTGKGNMLKFDNNFPDDLIKFIRESDTTDEKIAYINRLEENNKLLEKLRENDKIEIERLKAQIKNLTDKLINYENENEKIKR